MTSEMIRSGWSSAGLLLLGLLLTGCGQSGNDGITQTLVPMTGIVTMNGQPLANANVLFTPRGSTVGQGAYGTTEVDGTYELKHRSEKLGIEPGEYTVTITKMTQKDGSPIPDGKSAADVEAVQVIPPSFSDPTSGNPALQVSVSQSGGALNFDISG